MNKIIGFKSGQKFVLHAATKIADQILKKNLKKKIFRLGLSGGNTPEPIYKVISANDAIDWSLVEVYLVDERYVPIDDKYSNNKMIQETLLHNLNSKPRKVVCFNTNVSITESLREYEEQLDTSDSLFFDLVLLGIGKDGHTASLFPDSDALREKHRWVAHTTTDEHPVRDRMTLTIPALKNSREILFLVKGEDKRKTMKQLEKGASLPAAKLTKLKKSTILFCHKAT